MNILSIEGLSKSYGRKKILEGISFDVNKEEILGLVGCSGAGKSTLIKILIGFLSPSSGRVHVYSSSRHPIGFSMQNNSIYDSLSVRQNLFYFSNLYNIPRKIARERIYGLLEMLQLKEYERVIVKNLSGGTKKRVDIACALLGDPDILILDEPFLGLDPALVRSLLSFLKLLHENGKTLLISSHQLDVLAEICTQFVLLEKGKIYPLNKKDLKEIY